MPSRSRTQLSEPWHLSLGEFTYAQWSAVCNALSFGIASGHDLLLAPVSEHDEELPHGIWRFLFNDAYRYAPICS